MNDQFVGTSIDRAGHCILVVDDNPATRYATARTFRAAGFRTEEADCGAAALDMSANGMSAVVLDVHLPDIDGFAVCRHLRDNPRTALLPIVHLSAAYIEDKDKVAGLNSGADAYLTHPAEPPVLIATVQALIRARLAEDQLRKSEAKFRAIYTEADSGIALIDASGGFVEANPAMLRMLGRPAETVVGHKVWEFAEAKSIQAVRAYMEREDLAGAQWREVFAFSVPDGEDAYLEWTMSHNIEPGTRVAIVSNMSSRMRLEEQRESLLNREMAARTIAEQHSQTKDNFIAILSHELRNPLNAILMAATVLLERNKSPEMVAGLQMIKRNANTQARIIADILDMARITSGKMTLERELVDPKPLLADSIEGMRAVIDQRQLAIVLDTESVQGSVWLDATRFQQILWNILNNAIKFSEPGGVIDVALVKNDTELNLVVRDRGKGIEAGFLRTIFDKFTQGATPGNRLHGGLGLGMAIVKQLTHLHGGTVRVDSDGLGHGTTVTVSIPNVFGLLHADRSGISTSTRDPDGSLSTMTILVVEDEPQNMEMLAIVLKDRGAHVRTATSYDEALQSIAEATPDIIVSDIGLPGRDGYELMREIRRRESIARHSRRIPAIALTAFARGEDVAHAREAGFDAHVAKPLNTFDLVSSIKQLNRISSGKIG